MAWLHNLLAQTVAKVDSEYPGVQFSQSCHRISDNIVSQFTEDPVPIELAEAATAMTGNEPVRTYVRGNTDASHFMKRGGIRSLHMYSASHATHGPLEWTSSTSLTGVRDTAENIVVLWTRKFAKV